MASLNKKPSLFVIAGPNGAGKSSTSRTILEPYKLIAFDWDLVFWSLFRKFDCDPILERSIQDQASDTFENEILNCFERKDDFAFETNFHGANDIFWMNKAINAGYRTHLIFFYMHEVDHCIERVQNRVKLGGHPISDETVRLRFHKGLENLNEHFKLFDEVRIVDASLEWEICIIAEIINNKAIYIQEGFESYRTELNKLKSLTSVLY